MFDVIVSGNFLNGFEVPKKANGSKFIILLTRNMPHAIMIEILVNKQAVRI